jgi:hypothetical protein
LVSVVVATRPDLETTLMMAIAAAMARVCPVDQTVDVAVRRTAGVVADPPQFVGRSRQGCAQPLQSCLYPRLPVWRVGLMVFGGNEVARNLYRSLGYAEIAVFMQATLSSRPDSLSSSARGIHRLTTEARLHRGSPAHRGRFTRAGDPSPHLGSDLSDAGPRPTVGFSP